MFGPLIRTSPSSAMRISQPGQGLADRAEPVVLDGLAGGHGGGLRHPVALHHRHAAGVEELEDLLRDRRGAGVGLLELAAERPADVLEQRLVGLVVVGLQLGGDLLAGGLQRAHLHADADRALDLLRVAVGGDEGVDLLEDPRHRRQVARVDLHQLGHDLLRVAGEVGDPAAEVDRQQLDQQRVGVREREEEVDEVALLEHAELAAHVDHLAVVAVREHAALGRPGGAGRVDDRVGVVLADGLAALLELGLVAAAAPLAQVVERDRVGHVAAGVDHDHVLERGQVLPHLDDLGHLGGVLADDRHRLGVAGHPLALAGRVRRVDRDDDGAGARDREVARRPLGARRAQQRDTISGLDAEVDQAAADLGDGAAQILEGHAVPLAVPLEALRLLRAMALGGERHEIGDRLRPG